ncbi:MAG TPA: hypothetical protein PLP17_04000 [Oligoflexia bacterium]|nr:hypothetical protein [Oligoflexia bacterium]
MLTYCIVGWDYYLNRLQEIRKDDPDRNHVEPEKKNQGRSPPTLIIE